MRPMILGYFPPTITVGISGPPFNLSNVRSIYTAPGTDFRRIFCAGIGPLQLGVVLVMPFSRCALLSGLTATLC